ncbi:hypothetical protein ABFB09_07945 [Dehalogenimonas sp. THU2]|uniref:hypothetical protein n=1 Tax=Dehalogenimonas sp. THU2 TaxID=3151121 RepID=UPI0032183BB7
MPTEGVIVVIRLGIEQERESGTPGRDKVRLEDGVTEKELIELWDRAKMKVWHHDIRNYQVKRWFEKNCHIEADLDDFNSPLPPGKFSADGLQRFLRAVERELAY